MDAFDSYFPDLLVAGLLLLSAVLAAPVARRIGRPARAAFLFVGIVAGATGIDSFGTFEALPLEEPGAFALYAILLQGGLATGFREWRRCARPIPLLGPRGTAATAAALAALGHDVLRPDRGLAALVGIARSATDPAAVDAPCAGAATSTGRGRRSRGSRASTTRSGSR